MSEDGYTPKRIEEERRWKPTSLQRNPSINDEVEIKIRRARGILNKVRRHNKTPQTRVHLWPERRGSGRACDADWRSLVVLSL